MAETRTTIINYDFNWELENFTTYSKRYSDIFWPLKGRVSVFDPYTGTDYNPSFSIYCQPEGSYREKEVFKFYLNTGGRLPEDFRVQLIKIVIRSVSGACVEYSCKEARFQRELLLCTVVTQGETLRVADQVVVFSRIHNFIAIKFNFKISFILPVAPKPTITPAVNVPRKRGCNLCSDFKNLYDSKEMADVTITVGDDSLLAHKLVLMTRSPVFKAMLGNDCLESNSKTIQITDIDASVIDKFLKYLYCSEISDKSYDMVRNLYVLADKYAVDGLKEDCRDILEAELNEGTVCQLLEMSHLFTDGTLKEKSVEFVKQHFSVVSKKPEWIKICKDHPEMASDVLRMVTSFLDQSKSK
nr:TD and POZ domain-containing protein 3-like [Parasteatoda tepidariorum]